MRKIRVVALALLSALLVGAPAVSRGETQAAAAQGNQGVAEVRVLIDGRTVSGFTAVSGLGGEVPMIPVLCRPGDGKDKDCDGDGGDWKVSVLKALWELEGALEDLERDTWASSKARHDVAMNAIRNLKARVARTEEGLSDPAATLATHHDTVKNAIGNIRLAFRVFNESTVNEGPGKAAVQRVSEAIAALQGQVESRQIKYRPGRPVFGNITFERPMGSPNPLLDWYQQALIGKTDRKSISVIFLDQAGNEVRRYNLVESFPVKYSADTIDSRTSGMAREQIEVRVDRIEFK